MALLVYREAHIQNKEVDKNHKPAAAKQSGMSQWPRSSSRGWYWHLFLSAGAFWERQLKCQHCLQRQKDRGGMAETAEEEGAGG